MKFETLRNGLANFAGGLLPALVMLFTTPYIVNTMGDTSYGVLTLITAIVGYFAFLDLNVTAGSVKYVAEYHATGNIHKRNQMLTSGIAMYLTIGLIGCVLILLFDDALLDDVFEIPAELRAEAGDALTLAAFGFLFGQLQVYLNSVPQSIRRYDQTAVLETVFGIAAPLSTVAVLWLGYGLLEIVAVRVGMSVVNNLVLIGVIRRLLPDVALVNPDHTTLVALSKFSGFAYLSRLAALAYAQGDKLIIGALTSVSALTYYAVPFMLVNRLFALTFRLGGVMFPVASALEAQKETTQLREIYLYTARYVFFINCVLAAFLTVLAHEILEYWISPTMAMNGANVLVLISLASLAESLTNIPSLVNDGLGRPHITGSFAISRAILGVASTLVLVEQMGYVGAAWAQVGTASLMATLFLVYVHERSVPVRLGNYLMTVVLPSLPLLLGVVVFELVVGEAVPRTILGTLMILVAGSAFAAIYGLLFVFRAADREALFMRIRRRTVIT